MLLHPRALDSSQAPFVLRFSHSLSKAAFALGFFATSSLGTRRATAPNSSNATLNSNSRILFLINSLNSGRCSSAFAGTAFGTAGTQKRGLPSGMTSQQTAAVFGSPEGLGFTRSCLATVAGSGFFFFFFLEALAEELASSATSFLFWTEHSPEICWIFFWSFGSFV